MIGFGKGEVGFGTYLVPNFFPNLLIVSSVLLSVVFSIISKLLKFPKMGDWEINDGSTSQNWVSFSNQSNIFHQKTLCITGIVLLNLREKKCYLLDHWKILLVWSINWIWFTVYDIDWDFFSISIRNGIAPWHEVQTIWTPPDTQWQ